MRRSGFLLLCVGLCAYVLISCAETPFRATDGRQPRLDGSSTGGDVRGQDSASSSDSRPPGDGSSAGCTVFPANDPWNTDISGLTVHPNSDGLIGRMGGGKEFHPDFGTVWQGAPNGIPYDLVPGDQARVPINFGEYSDESDPGPYPIPTDAQIEGGPDGTADRHVIAVDMTNCKLYELFRAFPVNDGESWRALSGAVFDMKKNSLQRPMGWTSADAGGLPIYPGLVRYDEVESGEIRHALRVTFEETRRAIILPATHWASTSTGANLPPMGLRLRLKASFDISGYSQRNQVILTALKKYGMIVADNGGDWFLSGAPDSRWSDDELNELKALRGNDFEAVDTGPTYTNYNDVP